MEVNCTQESSAVQVNGTHDLVNNYLAGLSSRTLQMLLIGNDMDQRRILTVSTELALDII